MSPYKAVEDFETAICEYTGAPYAVTVTSCTMALLLAVKWCIEKVDWAPKDQPRPHIEIPKHTYVGVGMSIIHAGGWPVFRDDAWTGAYRLNPLPVWDSARWFTSGMYSGNGRPAEGPLPSHFAFHGKGQMACVSFHHTKTLGLAAHGGAILLDDPEAARWLRRARFDGRREGIPPKHDLFDMLGWHCYMTPATAAEGLMRLSTLPDHNEPLPWGPGTNSDYPDLSQMPIF